MILRSLFETLLLNKRRSNAFWLIAMVLFLASVFARGAHTTWAEDALSPLETQYFSSTYEQESQEARLNRLETFVYGEVQTGAPNERQKKLLQLLKNPSSPDLSTTQNTPDDQGDIENRNSENSLPQVKEPERPDATDYPTVTAMEKKVLGQEYRQEPISERLSRLEKAVFGKPSESMELVDRVDRLQAKVPASAILYDPEEALYNPANHQHPPVNSNASSYQLGFGDIYLKLDELERGFLDGESYTGRLIPERLSYLEQKVYGSTFNTDSLDTRLNRLSSAYQRRFGPYGQAGQTNAPYLPRPIIQSRPGQSRPGDIRPGYGGPAYTDYYQYYGPPGMRAPRSQSENNNREVQITQQSQWNTPFSSGQSRSQTTFMSSAPGTVVYQETTEYPGLANYQGPVIFNNPGGFGQTIGIQNLENQSQILNQLEMIGTGVMQPSLPFEARLNQLELRFIGRTQSKLDVNQRLNQISQLIRLNQLRGAGGISGLYPPGASSMIQMP